MLSWYRRSFLLDNSLIMRIIYNNLIWGRRVFGGEKTWYFYPNPEIDNAMNFVSVDLFRRNILEIIREARRSGSVPVLMTFAWSMPENYSNILFRAGALGYNNPTRYDQHPAELWGSPQNVRRGLQLHNVVIRELSSEYDVLLIDQESLMGKELLWFGDLCHLSDEGTDRFIRNISDYFSRNELL